MTKKPTTRVIPGYSYRRVVGTALRRIRGKARRVRYNVTVLVTVPPRVVVVAPRKRRKKTRPLPVAPSRPKRKPTKAVKRKAAPPSRPKAKPKPKPKPKPKAKPAPVPEKKKAKDEKLAEAARLSQWFNVRDYRDSLLAQKEMDGFEVTEVENEIYHNNPDDDVINAAHLFVWDKPTLPEKLYTAYRGIDGKGYKEFNIFAMVRIWFFVFDKRDEKFKIWCRTLSITIDTDYIGCYNLATDLYMKVLQDVEDQYDYYEVGDFLAWTAYRAGEIARRYNTKKARKVGGT